MGSACNKTLLSRSLATFPVLLLAIGFVIAVERSRPAAGADSYYSDGQTSNIAWGTAAHSTIPYTQLTLTVSLSATLATAFLPAAMYLHSYSAAREVAEIQILGRLSSYPLRISSK